MVSIYCSCKGHRLSSQHPHSSLQLKVQLQGIKLTPGLLRHQACTWHTHIHPSIHTHQIEINLKRDVDFKEGWGCSAVQWQNDGSMHEILGSVSSTVSKTNPVEQHKHKKE